jgi:uncharacterized DUF497 family protein
MTMFDFDPVKDERTRRLRGFGFLFAARIFARHTIERIDRRFDYGEERIVALGGVGEDTLTVVYTWRADEDGRPLRWIISARMANRRERRVYAAFFPG